MKTFQALIIAILITLLTLIGPFIDFVSADDQPWLNPKPMDIRISFTLGDVTATEALMLYLDYISPIMDVVDVKDIAIKFIPLEEIVKPAE